MQVCHLNILSHAQMVSLLAGVFAPYVGGNRTEKAHEQLHADDKSNLEVQEAVVRPCSSDSQVRKCSTASLPFAAPHQWIPMQ